MPSEDEALLSHRDSSWKTPYGGETIKISFFTNTSVPSSIILIEMLSESSLIDIFTAELWRLKRIIAGMGLSAPDGEDVLQDVSIKALKQRIAGPQTALLSREDGVKWLIKVTVNRCLMEHRRRRTFRRHAGEILKQRLDTKTTSSPSDEKAIVAEEMEIVRQSLQKLDDSLLAPMVLRYFCDLNSNEVGEILAISPSSVRSRLREAKIILAKGLLEQGVEP